MCDLMCYSIGLPLMSDLCDLMCDLMCLATGRGRQVQISVMFQLQVRGAVVECMRMYNMYRSVNSSVRWRYRYSKHADAFHCLESTGGADFATIALLAESRVWLLCGRVQWVLWQDQEVGD
jgi:hypothetical protein